MMKFRREKFSKIGSLVILYKPGPAIQMGSASGAQIFFYANHEEQTRKCIVF